jgi:hypothetical protein
MYSNIKKDVYICIDIESVFVKPFGLISSYLLFSKFIFLSTRIVFGRNRKVPRLYSFLQYKCICKYNNAKD